MIWKAVIIAEKNEAPAKAEAQLLLHMVNELNLLKHSRMKVARNFNHKNNKRHWLVKFAPFRTSWNEIVRRGIFTLRGVRNSQARNNLAAMRLGDLVLFYQSQQNMAIIGLMEVTREAYPDPTSSDLRWLTCNFKPVQTLSHPITLAAIKVKRLYPKFPSYASPDSL